MKGVSEIVSAVMIIALLMALSGLDFRFITNVSETVQSDVEEKNQRLAECRDKAMVIESAVYNGSATNVLLRSQKSQFPNLTVSLQPQLRIKYASLAPGGINKTTFFTPQKPESVKVASSVCGRSRELEVTTSS